MNLREWLATSALPLWSKYGIDRAKGGFFERFEANLSPIEEPRRARLVARQIYCFASGSAVGWEGDSASIVTGGVEFLLNRLVTPTGRVLVSVDLLSGVVDTSHDLYDYAFVLFSLAAASRLDLSPAYKPETFSEVAERITEYLKSYHKHPALGFTESLPLKSNPHMHLLEAFLEWHAVEPEKGLWLKMCEEIVELCLSKFTHAPTGAVTEYFDQDWSPCPDAQGLTVEPGHQFEWAWLLMRWAQLTNNREAFTAAVQLVKIGEENGICPIRRVAINALNEHLIPRDLDAKLWPQTERLKAICLLATHEMSSTEEAEYARGKIESAKEALFTYLNVDTEGAWHEIMGPDGSFRDMPIRASSLYHIVCATINT